MLWKVLATLLAITGTLAQDCDWGTFFAESENQCSSSNVEGVDVECSNLLPSQGVVTVKCSAGLQLTGYKNYHCVDGGILPRAYTTTCASQGTINQALCPAPSGKAANNMKFLQDAYHQYDSLLTNVDYHVSCKAGFMFKSGVEEKQVVGKCVYVNQRATLQSDEECLPACVVKDNNKLHQNVPNMDRIIIVYPSNTKQVGDGSILHAKAMCETGYGPVSQPVTLTCATKGVTAANSGYYLQQCDGEECLKCAQNCPVPEIRDGSVYARDSREGVALVPNTASIVTGERSAYVDCKQGLSLVGNRLISCDEGVVTTTVPSCTGAKVCSPVLVENGISLPDTSSSDSQEYEVSCNAGYTLGDPSQNTVSCDINAADASYSAVPQCFMGCAVPEIVNGRVVGEVQLTTDASPYQTSDTIEIACDDGYLNQGEGDVKCGVSGWVNLPQCLSEDEIAELGRVRSSPSAAAGILLSPVLLLTALFFFSS